MRDADKIVVLDKGEIVERGKHTDLLQKGGLYAHLWKPQTEMRGWKISDTGGYDEYNYS